MRPDLSWFFQDEETKELILCFVQSKLTLKLNAKTWGDAIDSTAPQFFYTMVAGIILCNPCTYPYFDVYRSTGNGFNMRKWLTRLSKMIWTRLWRSSLGKRKTHQNWLTLISTSSTKTANWQFPSNSQKTLRFLRVISSPDDEQKRHLVGKDDLVVLRWNKVKDNIDLTADSVVNNIGSVVL